MTQVARNRLRILAILAGISAFLIFQGMSAAPAFVERTWAGGLGPFFASVLSRATGWIPFSIAEIVVALFVVRQIRGVAYGVSMIRLKEWTPAGALGRGLFRLAGDLGVVVALFYLVWGFSYARAPIEQRERWTGTRADAEELTLLSLDMVDAANQEYAAIHGTDDAMIPTRAVLGRLDLTASLEKGWAHAARIMGESWLATRYGAPKPFLASPVLDYLGIAGIYFPFTGEASFNSGVPAESLPRVMAHEMSHQRGYAREDEANFMGFLAAALSPDPYPRYSAAVFAQRQLIGALLKHSPERAAAMAARRYPGVQRDIDASDAYWAGFEGPAREAADRVNNAYLRSQMISEGVMSYARSVELIVAYSRSHEGSLPRGGVVPK